MFSGGHQPTTFLWHIRQRDLVLKLLSALIDHDNIGCCLWIKRTVAEIRQGIDVVPWCFRPCADDHRRIDLDLFRFDDPLSLFQENTHLFFAWMIRAEMITDNHRRRRKDTLYLPLREGL